MKSEETKGAAAKAAEANQRVHEATQKQFMQWFQKCLAVGGQLGKLAAAVGSAGACIPQQPEGTAKRLKQLAQEMYAVANATSTIADEVLKWSSSRITVHQRMP